MILSFRTDKSGQTVLKEQSDQALHCLPFLGHHLDTVLHSKTTWYKFKDSYSNFTGVQIFRIFTVLITVSGDRAFGVCRRVLQSAHRLFVSRSCPENL